MKPYRVKVAFEFEIETNPKISCGSKLLDICTEAIRPAFSKIRTEIGPVSAEFKKEIAMDMIHTCSCGFKDTAMGFTFWGGDLICPACHVIFKTDGVGRQNFGDTVMEERD